MRSREKFARSRSKILPAPFATSSAGNGPKVVARPEGAWPQVPEGFKVEQYATGLDNPRIIRTAPNGDIFVAETKAGDVRVFRGITSNGKPEQMSMFASGLNEPFGINFYPPGPNPEWVYVGNTDSVGALPLSERRYAGARSRHNTLQICRAAEATQRVTFNSPPMARKCLSPWARLQTSTTRTPRRQKKTAPMFWNSIPDGSGMRVFAYGIRNCVGLGDESEDRRIVVLGQRTRRAGRQPGSRLHHPCAGRRLLWLALVVHGRPSGSPAQRQTSRTQRQSHHARRLAEPAQCLAGNHFLRRQTISRQNIREISSPPNMARGTGPSAWATN